MDIRERIAQANQQAVACIIDSDPYWVDIRPDVYKRQSAPSAFACTVSLSERMITSFIKASSFLSTASCFSFMGRRCV